jgi:nuclear pore complex protein Nup98-Nup96
LDTLHSHAGEAARQVDELNETSLEWSQWVEYTNQVWDLMLALWGRLDDCTGEETVETHKITMARREAVSKWMERVVGRKTKEDMEKAALKKNLVGGVLANLTGGKVSEACKALQSGGDHRTALLVAQVGGGGEVSRMVQQQLERWTEVRADHNISQDRIKLLSLVADCPVWSSTRGPVNTCSSLDWVRALACHLWYLTHPLASTADALHQFEIAWRGVGADGPYCTAPAPSYLGQGVLGQAPLATDIRYQLLRLYCDRSTSMENMLDPSSHTGDKLDSRMGWLVGRVVGVLGYRHITDQARDRLHRDTASQAERVGFWHWAVFVLQHIEDGSRRKEAIEAVLDRNIASCDEEKERFLVDDLGIPVKWVARARATLARAQGRPRDRVDNLLVAERWVEAHEVLVKDIAPDCIIGQEYRYLSSLLSQLSPPHIADNIPGWQTQGWVFHQFISVEEAVSTLVQARDEDTVQYELEKLKPSVSSLCRAVGYLPVDTPKERLAQSEIAKKVAHLMRAVHTMVGNTSANTARQLAENLSTLPLPEDYALQELRSLTRSYMMEIA